MDMAPNSPLFAVHGVPDIERTPLAGQLDGLLENMPSGVVYCRMLFEAERAEDFVCLYANPVWQRELGVAGVAGRAFSAFFPEPFAARAALLDAFGRVARGGAPESLEVFCEGPGQWFSVFAYAPAAGHCVAFFARITEHKQAEAKLQERAKQLQFVLEGSELGFWDWNIVSGEVKRNEQWARMLGYTYEEIRDTAQQWADFVHPDDRQCAWESIFSVIEGRSAAHKLEYRMLHKDGSIRWILDQAKVMQRDEYGNATRMCGTHTDVTERKLLEEELTRQAHVDYLTGVSNRRHFMACAEQELRRAKRYAESLAIFMIDIDHFKRVNDRHGHRAGDTVLVALARLCQATLRSFDILGRLGGEEFAVLLPETDGVEAVRVAERLREAIAVTRVPLGDGACVQITVSIGVAALTSPDDNVDVLLSCADAALYEAKNSGRNRVCRSAWQPGALLT